MCDDLERARQNREMIFKKLFIWAYLQVEAWLADNPVTDLPYWVFSEGFINENVKVRAGRKGGLATANRMTPKERITRAKKAINTRWYTKQTV